MNIVIMITGSIVGVAYITELYRLVFWCRMSNMLSIESYWTLLVGILVNDDL
jgi:hypothetical protein